jgi:hypothetical protein
MRLKIAVFLFLTSIGAAVVVENNESYRSILDQKKQTIQRTDLSRVSPSRPLLPSIAASIGAPVQVSPDDRT